MQVVRHKNNLYQWRQIKGDLVVEKCFEVISFDNDNLIEIKSKTNSQQAI